MLIATHDGTFHADDVFAVAVLRLIEPDLEIVRTRDRELIAAADVRVDVGLRDDAASGDFDHHQRGGAGERANGIPYASFGLVWRHHGLALSGGDERVAAVLDERVVQGVDALDTGIAVTTSVIGDIRPMTISDLIAGMNPAWDEEVTPAEQDTRFAGAVATAEGILRRQLALANSVSRAHRLVREAMTRGDDPRVIELDRKMPWFEPVVTGAPEALYVIYPKSDGLWLQAVPREIGSFANRKDLPASWAGLNG